MISFYNSNEYRELDLLRRLHRIWSREPELCGLHRNGKCGIAFRACWIFVAFAVTLREWMANLTASLHVKPAQDFTADGLKKGICWSVWRNREGVVKLHQRTEATAGIAGYNDVRMWKWCTVLVQ